MAEFKSYKSYWKFAHSVATCRRYVSDADQTEFLQTVLATSVSRHEAIAVGSIFWRSQRGNDWELGDQGDEEGPCSVQAPLGPARMKPRANCAREGRANPKGIPCLYVATHDKTAVSEVRPWIGEYVSLAQFALKRDVRIVNCTADNHKLILYSHEPGPEEHERAVWQDIDRAFSQPVTPDDDTAAYAPTQVLAEYFREHGLDGIAYRSSVGPGHNLAFFDIEVAVQKNCTLVQIASMNLGGWPTLSHFSC